jgi:hypothetical protein
MINKYLFLILFMKNQKIALATEKWFMVSISFQVTTLYQLSAHIKIFLPNNPKI